MKKKSILNWISNLFSTRNQQLGENEPLLKMQEGDDGIISADIKKATVRKAAGMVTTPSGPLIRRSYS